MKSEMSATPLTRRPFEPLAASLNPRAQMDPNMLRMLQAARGGGGGAAPAPGADAPVPDKYDLVLLGGCVLRVC